MLPPKKEFEKVRTDDFVIGVIADVEHDKEHEFKGKNMTIAEAVRIVFHIEGMKFPKKTSWMTFSYNEKSNLYQKYLASLVESATPNMEFHIEQLKGLKVKMLWKDNPKNPDFQGVDSIRPADGRKIAAVVATQPKEEEVPF